ncbi:MAG: O-antigen ligase family protein, partial [Patescibacteria group bacterium]
MIFILLLIVSLAAFAWLSIRHFRIALPLFIALLPTYLIRFSIGPLPTTFLEVCFWVLFGSWIIHKGRHVGRPLQTPSRSFTITVFIFIILSVTSLAVVPGEHVISSLGLWRAYFLEPFLFGWMVWEILSTAKDPSLRQDLPDEGHATRLQLFLSLAFSGFILAVLGIVQYATGLGIPAPWDVELRITSVFDYPNALGLFLAPILSALLVFGVSTWKKRLAHEKMFVAGASFFTFIAIVLAQTEAALVAIPGALFISLLVSPLSSQKQKIAATLLAMVALVGAFAFSPAREKLLLRDLSGQVRLSQWSETLSLLADHPLTGAGIGYYPELLRAYHQDWQYEIFQYPHMLLLNVWVELGLFGVLVGLVGLIFVAKKTWG